MAGEIPSLLLSAQLFMLSTKGLGQNGGIWVHSAEAETDSQAEQLLLADVKISPVLARPMIHSYGGVGYSLEEEEVK